MNNIALLPLELILSYLPPAERIGAARVCRRWATLVKRPEFWRSESYTVRNQLVLQCITRGGDFDLLYRRIPFASYEIRGSASSWLKIACRAGHLRAAKSLSAELDRTSAEFGDYALGHGAEYYFYLEEGPSLLSAACAGGHLEVAQWLAQRANINIYESVDIGMTRSIFHIACQGGNAALVRWLGEQLPISKYRQLIQSIGKWLHAEAVINACSAGDLASVEWLVQIVDPSQRGTAVGLLEAACARGHLHVAQWVATYYGLARETIDSVVDAKTYPNPLLSACRGGHTAVVAWLIERFRYIGSDLAPASGWHSPLELAQISGNLQLVQLLHDQNCAQGISPLTDRCVFHFSVRDPDATIPRWLTARYGLSRGDIDYEKSLANACESNQLAAVMWVVGEFYSPACTGRAWLRDVRSVPIMSFLYEAYNLSATDIVANIGDMSTLIAERLQVFRWIIDRCDASVLNQNRAFVRHLLHSAAQISDSADFIGWLFNSAAELIAIDSISYSVKLMAPRPGCTNIVKWLVGRYGSAFDGEAVFVIACECGNIDLAIFLADYYGLQLTDRKQLIREVQPGVVAEWLKLYTDSR